MTLLLALALSAAPRFAPVPLRTPPASHVPHVAMRGTSTRPACCYAPAPTRAHATVTANAEVQQWIAVASDGSATSNGPLLPTMTQAVIIAAH